MNGNENGNANIDKVIAEAISEMSKMPEFFRLMEFSDHFKAKVYKRFLEMELEKIVNY